MEDITLKRFRRLQRMTQSDFAKKLGYKPSYISSLELSKRNLSEQFLYKLEDVFNVQKKGFRIINSVDKNTNSDIKIHNNDIKNSQISNSIGDGCAEYIQQIAALRIKLEAATEKIISLQAELLEDARRNNTKNL